MSIVKDALIAEITEKAALSQEYYDTIQSAKTKVKKKIYEKKLAAHNNMLADLLISLDKLEKSDYNSQDINNNGNKADVECEQNQSD